MFCFTFVPDHNADSLMLYSGQLENMYSYLNSSLKLSDIVRGLSCQIIVLQLIIIIQTHHSLYFILQIFTLSIHIMFSLIPSDANDPQGLMRR